MTTPRQSTLRRASIALLVLALIPSAFALGASGGGVGDALEQQLAGIPAERVPSGILHDRVLSLGRIEDHDGGFAYRPITLRDWRQIYDEIHRASRPAPAWPSLGELTHRASGAPRGVVPIALMDIHYSRLRRDALASGALVVRDGRLVLNDNAGGADGAPGAEGESRPATPGAFVIERLFAAAPLRDRTYQGAEVTFRLDPSDIFTDEDVAPVRFAFDFDDGRGPVALRPGEAHVVRYATAGIKTIRLHTARPDGAMLSAAFLFEVRALRAPAPHYTRAITATIPYLGALGSGSAYVYLSDQHAALTQPVVVIEGFDLDNSMGWDELYELLNRQQLLETLRADGYDAVVLDFTDATDYLQRNAFVVTALIEQVRAEIAPEATIALVGASMGGLIGRYALAYMEANDFEHAVRTFVSFDAPQTGADIPLGLQYWLWFFADQSPEAAAWLTALDSPAARQLLLYHHTDPPGTTGVPDPLRAVLEADIAAVGGYPALPRKVAVANGSGSQVNQGFSAGGQIIEWEYNSFLVDITGNVWSVPDQTSATVFHGLIDFLLLPPDESIVTVSGTRPCDNAPGGWRDTMVELDATDPGYGDIVALHPNHCFIPAVSALALDTNNLFYDIAGDPDLLMHTPFDAVYFPLQNQEHVDITAESAAWFIDEIELSSGDVADDVPGAPRVAWIAPPALRADGDPARIRFAVPAAGPARLTLHDAAGRRVAILAQGRYDAGVWEVSWNGRAADGHRLERGVHFLRLSGTGFAASARVLSP